MTTTPTFAHRTVWHIVDGDVIEAPKAGTIYLFKCSRWAAIERVDGVVGGNAPANEEVCQHCQANFDTEAQVQPEYGADAWS